MTDTLAAEFAADFGIETEQSQEQVQQEVQPAKEPEQPQEEQAREPEPAPQPEVTQEEEKSGERPRVGLDKYLSEREKRQAAERKAEEAERQLQQLREQQAPKKIPDPYEDPEGYDRYVRQTIDEREYGMRVQLGGQLAEQVHGKELVETAVQWAVEEAGRDPTFAQRLRMQPNPPLWVVEQYNRDQFFQKYGSNPSALEALKAPAPAPVSPVAPQPMAAPVAVTKQPAPIKSLATAPSTGAGHQVIPEGSAFDALKFNLDR